MKVGAGTVSTLLLEPNSASAILVLAHGAGGGMRHASMTAIAEALARVGVATLRFQFPYMEAGRRRVDNQATSVATVLAAADAAASAVPDLPIFLGGHSFGGRMASHAALQPNAESVAGLIFFSYPLHPRGKPSTDRATHLVDVVKPMIFLSGTRDALADAELLTGVVNKLGVHARLHWLDTADHSYRVLKRTRASSEDIFDEMARVAKRFVDENR